MYRHVPVQVVPPGNADLVIGFYCLLVIIRDIILLFRPERTLKL